MEKRLALFVLAHQDDEFGVFYEIYRLVNRGERVVVAYLTSGSVDGSWCAQRNRESIAVLNRLGVPESDVYFLGAEAGIPDGALVAHLETGLESVIDLVKTIGTPHSLYLLAWEGGHQDHDAAHLIGIVTAKSLGIIGQCFQFPLYTGARLRSIFFRLFVSLPENGEPSLAHIPWRLRARFLRLCFCYPSQLKTWIGLFPFFLADYIFWGKQVLQRVSTERVRMPPHRGSPLYERRGFYSYSRFQNDASGFVKRHL